MPTETATTVLKIGVVGAAAHTALSLAERKKMARKRAVKPRQMGGKRLKLKPRSATAVLGRGKFVVVGTGRADAERLARHVRSQGGKAGVQEKGDVVVKVSSDRPVTLTPAQWRATGVRGEHIGPDRRFS
jgi:hypothetical protein